jgi:SET domain-containing protein 6
MKDGETDAETILHLGNPSDVAEVRADLVVHVVQTTIFGSMVKDVNARIEWWLDEAEDEYVSLSPSLFLLVIRLEILSFLILLSSKGILTSVRSSSTFVLSLPESGSSLSAILPPGLISLTHLLILSEPDFESARSKGKLPKGKLRKGDVKDNKEVLEILDKVFEQREGLYIGGNVEVRLYFILTTIDPGPLTCLR